MITETYIDKSSWPEGEWKSEPDHVVWLDTITGYRCIVRRSDVTGALCGYVCVPRSHPYHGKSHTDIDDIDVHGGLTYSELCDDTGQWILGFDCSHADDLCPVSPFSWASYRNITYVEKEIVDLKQQLHKKEKTNNKGEKLMNTEDLKRYNKVLYDLETEMLALKDTIEMVFQRVDRANIQLKDVRSKYNFLQNIYETIKLEEKEHENNKS